MDTDMHSAELVSDGIGSNVAPTPAASPAIDGKGADYGATGQGGGEEHIRFSGAVKTEKREDEEDGSGAADAFSEFGEPQEDSGSSGVSLL